MAKEEKKRVRITGQFRSRDAMVYDFICDSIRITISVSSSEPDNVWNAEAVAKQVPDAQSMRGAGQSRGGRLMRSPKSGERKTGRWASLLD